MAFEFPREAGRTDLDALWEDVWRIVEQLRLLEERLDARDAGHDNAVTATGSASPHSDITGDMT